MKSLILDTSSECALLAFVEEPRVLYRADLLGGPALSKSLGAEVKKIVDAFAPPYDRIVVGIGPGSFTGIRVGASMAQALSFGWQIPLYTASSLAGFAPAEQGSFAVALDARSGGIYVQIGFDTPLLLPLSEAERLLSSSPLIASPHPARILERLPSLASVPWLETRPDPLHLLRSATPASLPLSLHYLSSPSGS